MTFKDAKKLHNEDEIIIKTTGEVGIVKNVYVQEGRKIVCLDIVIGNAYLSVTHKEIK